MNSTNYIMFSKLLMSLLVIPQTLVLSVQKCYIGALEVYENPRNLDFQLIKVQCSIYFISFHKVKIKKLYRTLTMLDLMEVNTYKLMDCNVAHHTKEIVQYDNT